MPEVVQATVLAVALSCSVYEGQVTWRLFGVEAFFDCQRDFLGESDPDKAASRHGIAGVNQSHRLLGGDQFGLMGNGARGTARVQRRRHVQLLLTTMIVA